MKENYQFPFGQPLQKVAQKDRTPKKAFVLGVYASAVHARWIDAAGKQKVSALAVASEPEIFWHGENAEEIISAIPIPAEAGKLVVPGNKNMNGPSGKALDELFLAPLGLDRSNTWLCDLLPYSRVNPSQRKAIDGKYEEARKDYGLNEATIPDFDKAELKSETRREEILAELKESQAETLILLGDLPIKHFLHHFEKRYSRLADFGKDADNYGKPRKINIDNKEYDVIALCHPRQAARLGHSSKTWGELHDGWMKRKNVTQLYELKSLRNFGYFTLLTSLFLFGALFYWNDWFSMDIRWNQIVRVSIWAAATTLLYNGLDPIIAFKKKKNPNRFWRFVYKWVHNKVEN